MAYRTDRPPTQPTRLEQWEVVFWGGVRIKGVPIPSVPPHVCCDGGCIDAIHTSVLLDSLGNLLLPDTLGTDPYNPDEIAELLDPGMTVRTFRGSVYTLGARAR